MTWGPESYRRRRVTYSFRAWIDGVGMNASRDHERWCLGRRRPCEHFRLWDLNRMSDSRNIVRVVRRSRPRYLAVHVGRRCRQVLRLGRKP